MTYNTYMEKYIVLLKNGQAMVFDDYTEAFHSAELYTKTTGNVAAVEQFWSSVTPEKLTQTVG
jgi:hypothetical protein